MAMLQQNNLARYLMFFSLLCYINAKKIESRVSRFLIFCANKIFSIIVILEDKTSEAH